MKYNKNSAEASKRTARGKEEKREGREEDAAERGKTQEAEGTGGSGRRGGRSHQSVRRAAEKRAQTSEQTKNHPQKDQQGEAMGQM